MKGQNAMEYLMTYGWVVMIVIIVAAALLFLGVFDYTPRNNKTNTTNQTEPEINTTGDRIGAFAYTSKELCTQNDKPIVILFSSSRCPHCNWISPIFDDVVTDYMEENQIVAYHLQLDTKTETLSNTSFDNMAIDEEIINTYMELNPRGAVPAMLFGCEYFSLGAVHERDDNGEDITEQEFRAVIDEILEG